MVPLDAILDALGDRYPWALGGGDPLTGLLVGSRSSRVRRVTCSLEIDAEVLGEVAGSGSDLLVAHDPHLLGETGGDEDGPAGRIRAGAVRSGVNIVGCGLNAEVASRGTCDLMARGLGLIDATPVVPSSDVFIAKVVVFVPEEALEPVFRAMSDAGAGVIGDYTRCSFRSRGEGSFLPGDGAAPYSGEVGRLSRVEEIRLEMPCPSFAVERVLAAMLEEHPYQEVAYDVYRSEAAVPWGRGRIGRLEKGCSLSELRDRIASWSSSENVVLAGRPDMEVERVAVAPGSGDGLAEGAWRCGAGAFVTGELSWRSRTLALERGVGVITIGYVESKRAIVSEMVELLRSAGDRKQWDIEVRAHS